KPLDRERAQSLRGGCCGSPPPDPSNECPNADGEGECPCEAGPGGGPGGSGPGGGGPGGGCPLCASFGAKAPVYFFGMASANFQLKDMPMWSEPGRGPWMRIQLFYNRVATDRMATNAGAN